MLPLCSLKPRMYPLQVETTAPKARAEISRGLTNFKPSKIQYSVETREKGISCNPSSSRWIPAPILLQRHIIPLLAILSLRISLLELLLTQARLIRGSRTFKKYKLKITIESWKTKMQKDSKINSPDHSSSRRRTVFSMRLRKSNTNGGFNRRGTARDRRYGM